MEGVEGPGAALSRRFWSEVVAPALPADVRATAAAALLGPGSEVLGFDDTRSFDHDMGPRLALLVPEDRRAECPSIASMLDAALPARFEGLPVRFATTADPVARHRVVVTTVADLVDARCGLDLHRAWTMADWLRVPTQELAGLTAGVVLSDPSGELAEARASLAWYPTEVWRYVLGCQWRRLAQREPFLGRTAEVGDELGARLVAAGLARDLMRLAFLIERRWAPYEKWLGTAFATLDAASSVTPSIQTLLASPDATEREAAYVAAGTDLAERFVALGLTAPIDVAPQRFHDRPYLVLGADRFATACVPAELVERWGWRGAVDQWIDSTDVLTDPSDLASVR